MELIFTSTLHINPTNLTVCKLHKNRRIKIEIRYPRREWLARHWYAVRRNKCHSPETKTDGINIWCCVFIACLTI